MRNKLGQFCKEWSVQKKVAFGVMVFCAVVPTSMHWGEKAWAEITREITYVAAPRAYADIVKPPKTTNEILNAIADCESGERKADGTAVEGSAKQFYADGKVVKNFNKNKTVDIGKYQINTMHIVTAVRMDIDIMTEEGNHAFAEFLYKKNGTSDWSASKSCHGY